ncbi:MAG TPA: hypothetical protein VF624_15630 [Tepidisphaeraceae bacterium]
MGAFVRTIFVLLLMLLAASSASAKTKLDIQAGFSDRYRPGRWVPVTVVVQSDRPHSGVIELRVPNASSSTMTIRQQIGVGTAPQSYVLYAPLALQTDPLTATLFDAATNKVLAEWPPETGNFNARLGLAGEQVNFALFTTGRTPGLQGYRRTGAAGATLVDHIRPPRLPNTPIGLDAADVLLVLDPDWSQISPEQQRAVVGWVRAGGTLLLWPGSDPLPPDAPIAEILPATLGEPSTLQLPPATLQKAGLSRRFGSLTRRTLTAKPGAATVDLFNPSAEGSASGEASDKAVEMIVGKIGFGQVGVVPIDISTLQFGDTGRQNRFWDAVFDRLLPIDTPQQNNYYNPPDMQAAAAGLDRIGDIPNTGAFGFTYVAVLIAAMMLLVGPIDYFVLRKIGHQPWTWGTTLGWIGLITIAAIYAGHLLRSGDLHFRTLRLVEQAGDVASESALALVYAPRSSTYSVTAADGWWWQPVPTGNRYSSTNVTLPLDTYQSAQGNLPERMWIDVWSWRFLQGKRVRVAPPVLGATFKVAGRRLRGTVTNLSGKTLRNIQIETNDAVGTTSFELLAGQSLPFDSALKPKNASPEAAEASPSFRNYDHQSGRTFTSYTNVFDIDAGKTSGVRNALARGAAVFYAEQVDPASDITIDQPGAIVQHQSYVRAIIEPVSSPEAPGEETRK